jgi:hypothetical protein
MLRDQCEEYIRAIQWILLYYFEGVPSWSWWGLDRYSQRQSIKHPEYHGYVEVIRQSQPLIVEFLGPIKFEIMSFDCVHLFIYQLIF